MDTFASPAPSSAFDDKEWVSFNRLIECVTLFADDIQSSPGFYNI
jgi:hypothetical protein